MNTFIRDLFGEKIFNIYSNSLSNIKSIFENLNYLKLYNQNKVLNAFKECRISNSHFVSTTGYAYSDLGRDGIENLYCKIFGTESSLVRLQFVNGTHAIGCAILGNLNKDDVLFSITGRPYDTIENIIGINSNKNGSLMNLGIKYIECDLKDNNFDKEFIINTIRNNSKIKMVYIQRSRGYSLRKSILSKDIEDIVKVIKSVNEDVDIFVDNCYGEFVDIVEPTHLGVDLMAGSLIKNIGGGFAPTGGYIVGRKQLVENAAYRLTVPGIGSECGASLIDLRQIFQEFLWLLV